MVWHTDPFLLNRVGFETRQGERGTGKKLGHLFIFAPVSFVILSGLFNQKEMRNALK